MELSFKNLRSCRGSDGMAWSGTLYEGARKIADVIEGGYGGCLEIHWFDMKAGKSADGTRVEAYAASLPAEKCKLFPEGLAVSVDTLLSRIADESEQAKKFERACKTKTIYRTADGQMWTDPRPYTPELRAALVAKYAPTEFINDRFGGFVANGAALAKREADKRMARLCRNATIFSVNGRMMKLPAPFSPAVRAQIMAKYGVAGVAVEFENERLAASL